MRISDWSSDLCSSDLLARAGAIIEALAQPLYLWLFGLATYGLYVVLWGAINLVSNIVDLSMTSALQRIAPTVDAAAKAHGAAKFALTASVLSAALGPTLVDRKSVVQGKTVAGRVEQGGRRSLTKKKATTSAY